MNKVNLIGRFTKDPEIHSGETAVCRGTLAVARRTKESDEADFISLVAFGKTAEFISKYFTKGMKAAVVGRIQTGSYTNKDGQKVYTTDVVVEDIEFVEKKEGNEVPKTQSTDEILDFMNLPN